MNNDIHLGSTAGFTLIELIVVLLLMVLLAGMTAPSMRDQLHRTRLKLEASRLMSAINLARNEAITRNAVVSLCPSSNALSAEPICGGHLAEGFIVFVNPDGDDQRNVGVEHLIQVYQAIAPRYSLTNRAGTAPVTEIISYRPDGSSRRNRTLMFCARDYPALESLSVVMNMMGRPRLARGWGQCLPA